MWAAPRLGLGDDRSVSDEVAVPALPYVAADGRRARRVRRREHSSAVWQQQALAEITTREFMLERLPDGVDPELRDKIDECLQKAQAAACGDGLKRRGQLLAAFRGANVERTWGLIDAADESLLRVVHSEYVIGQLPRIQRRAHRSLAPDDPRRIELDAIARRHFGTGSTEIRRELLTSIAPALCDTAISERDRAGLIAAITACKPHHKLTEREHEVIVATFHSASAEARKQQTRVRSFRNMLLICALILTLAAAGLALLGGLRPDLTPLCFEPDGRVVCPTQMTAVAGDAPVTGQPAAVETPHAQAKLDETARRLAAPVDVLLIGAALAGAAALRGMRGTSTPYGIPLALAVLKLPTGALTAALGLLLMRGEFVPGLTALDSPAQIIAWAIVFGSSQQLFTRFVDQRGQSVLDSAGSRGTAPDPADPTRDAPATRAPDLSPVQP
jgi:hypothetical protein